MARPTVQKSWVGRRTAVGSLRVPTIPTVPGSVATSPYTKGSHQQLQTQIEANLARDRSLGSMMSAINAIDQHAANASFANRYRQDALQMAQQQLRTGNAPSSAWIATAKLSTQLGNDSLFRQTTNQFVEKHPTNPHAHYFKGMMALEDRDWKSAELSLRRAKKLGLPEESIAEMLKIAIDNQKWVWEYAQIVAWVIGVWFVGLGAIFLLGLLLSRFTLKAIEQNQLDAKSISTRFIRRVYRIVVGIAGFYYYISLPIVLAGAIALPLAIGYASLLTPYLNLVLLAVILIGGLGGVLTAVSGIRTALVRIPKREHQLELKRDESPAFWELVGRVAGEMDTRGVDEIWIVPGTDMAVLEQGSWWSRMRNKGRRVLLFGVALLDDFTTDSLQAILAHEYTHFRNRDTAGGDVALRVQIAMHQFAGAIEQRGKIRWWDITIHFLRWFHYLFTRLTLGASRLQEVLADRAAVELYGTDAFVDGLTHVIRRSIDFDQIVSIAIDQKIESDAATVQFFDPGPTLKDEDKRSAENAFHEIMHQKTTVHDSHPAPVERIALAHQWNVSKETRRGLVRELFDQSAGPLRGEMSTLLSDLAANRASEVVQLNEFLVEAMSDAIRKGDLDAKFQRARAYFSLGQHDKAIEDLSAMMKQTNGHVEVRWFRAVVYQAAGRHEESIADLNEMIKRSRLVPDELMFEVQFSFANQMRKLGRLEDAALALDRAVKLAPNSLDAAALRVALAEEMGTDSQPKIVKLRKFIATRWPMFDSAKPTATDTAPKRELPTRTSNPEVQKASSFSSRLIFETLLGIAAVFLVLATGLGYFATQAVAAVVKHRSEVASIASLSASRQELKKESSEVESEAVVDSPEVPAATTASANITTEIPLATIQENMKKIAEAVKLSREKLSLTNMTMLDADTKLSWRVHLLPYLGEAELYREFKLWQPWHSPHNLKLLSKMPSVYQCGGSPQMTRIRSVPRKGSPNRIPLMFDAAWFSDGNDQTAVVLVAGEAAAIEWTKPEMEALSVDEINAIFFRSEVTPSAALLANGKVLMFPKGIHPVKLDALVSDRGNEHVSNSWFKDEESVQPPPEGYRHRENKEASPQRKASVKEIVASFERFSGKIKELRIPKDSGLSWRVHLLPLIGHQEIYQEFRLDEPWDSPHNYSLIELIPEEYQLGAHLGRTRFRGVGSILGALGSKDAVLKTKLAVTFATHGPTVTWTKPDSPRHFRNQGSYFGTLVTGEVIRLASTTQGSRQFASLVDTGESTKVKLTFLSRKANPVTKKLNLVRRAKSNVPKIRPKQPIRGVVKMPAAPPAVPASGSNESSFYALASKSPAMQVCQAIQRYQSAYRKFPNVQASSLDGDLKLSWRVELLPFLGEEKLYKRFDREQPWDSPTNLPLLDEMPDVYRTLPDSDTLTQICMFIGPGMCLSQQAARNGIVSERVRIEDNRSSTIFAGMVGADKAVPWTKPIDVEVDPRDLIGSLGEVGEQVELITSQLSLRLPSSLPKPLFAALVSSKGRELTDGKMLLRYAAHAAQEPLYSEAQARAVDAYHLSAILASLIHKYQREGRFLDNNHLSWRVHLLPALDHLDLYQQFRLDEPWDSPHNRQLIPCMPDLYRDGGDRCDSTTTRVMAVRGEGAVCLPDGDAVQWSAIKDRPEQTILLMQSPKENAVVWTKPEDFPFEIGDPKRGLEEVPIAKGILVGLKSGHVGYLSPAVSDEEFRAMVTPSGREDVDIRSRFIQ